ncbi:MAG: biotin transporter BioY [Dialister invisus]
MFQPTFGYLLGFIAGAWLTGNCRSIWKNCHLSAFYLRTWQDFLWSTFWNGLCIRHK